MAADSSERFVRLNQLADEFAERYRRGERPSLQEYIARHPELADDIREYFPALAEVEQVREERQEVSEPQATGPLPPLERLGDFRILREIGHGGMGVVYEAEQLSLGRHVALKVLPRPRLLDGRTRQRFEREAKAAAKLHHTNIVPVFGTGEHDGTPYYVMQFIPGTGLDVVIDELARVGSGSTSLLGSTPAPPAPRREASAVALSLLSGARPGAPAADPAQTCDAAQAAPSDLAASGASAVSSSVNLPGQSDTTSGSKARKLTYWQSVARVGIQVADALGYAHKQGILHRDIKPSNLLLDVAGTVWVTDFGLAKADDQQNLTHTGDIVGTLRYMPPEAFDGKADARSDVYSLGLTLYELVALRPAFDEPDRNKLVKRLTTGEPEPVDRVRKGIPRDLETIIHKAIDREPARRYQKAEELADDLRRFLDDQPVKARRISSVERLGRWARRNRGVAAALGVIGLLLVTAAIVSGVAAARFGRLAADEEAARHAAEEAADEAHKRGESERWERYRSNLAAAAGALQLQNSGAARSALEAAPPEHRGWEWQYFYNQLDGARLVLPAPGGKYRSHVLSPSGKQVAVCGLDQNEVYLYDVATGKREAVLRGHSAPATGAAYRPDGKQIATISNDQTIRLWDPATGQQTALLKPEVASPKLDRDPVVAYSADGSRIVSSARYEGACTSRLWDATTGKEIAVLAKWHEQGFPAAFSSDGKRVAVSSGENAHLCDAVTGRRLAVLGPHGKTVAQLAYSPDGKRIASADGSEVIHLWDGESGKEVAVLRGHTAAVNSLLFSPDGLQLVSGSQYPDSTARLWDAATGRPLAVLAGHKNETNRIAFSPDGKRVATPSADQTARLWDAHTGQLLAVLSGHTDKMYQVVFSPNGTRVVTSSDDATLRLWDAQTGELISVLRGHGDSFPEYPPPDFTPDGARLVSGSKDGTVRIWDMSLVERNGILKGHTSYVYDVAFNPGGQQVASAAWDGTARLWDATTGLQTGLLKHKTGIINSVAYSANGRLLATAAREQGIILWDVASQKPARDAPFVVPGFWDNRAAVNPKGTVLASGCADGPVRLWDVATGRQLALFGDGHVKESRDAAFHPDGGLLATTGVDGTVRLWDVVQHVPVAVLRGHTDTVWCVAFSADGKLLASCSSDKTIRLWDTLTDQPLEAIPLGSVVYGVAFSPDGTRLAAACRDNTIRLIDVASRQQVAELRGHTDYVHAVAWSPDGTRLISGSGDFTVRVWDALPPAVRARPPHAYVPPRGYVCYRAAGPITLDGKLDEPAWQAAPWTDDFVDIEGELRLKPRFRTRAKMLWDDHYFYIAAELEEPHVQASYTRRDSYIFHEDNDFEVFLNPDGNNHYYAELEMNALNTVWDLRLKKPYRDRGKAEDHWDIPGLKTAVHVHGTVNNPRDTDTGWTIEIAIPLSIVEALRDHESAGTTPASARPRDGDQWRVNFSRVQWRFDIVHGKYVRRKDRAEDNWVWSPQGVVNMHQPETWGYVQFSTAPPGQATFRPDPAGPAKHVLHRIYHAQRAFHKEHGRYARALAELSLTDLGHETLAGPPRLEADEAGFRASVDVRLPDGAVQRWWIRQDSLVWPDR
jgi:WD40 repeat protein/serine/threonine protein kinase